MNCHFSSFIFSAVVASILVLPAANVFAQATDTDDHTVTITVQSIDAIQVGDDVSFDLDVVSNAGGGLDEKTAVSSYSVTTNGATARKVVASLDANLPNGIQLQAELAAPGTGASAGPIALDITPRSVVTGITATAASDMTITYRASATSTATPDTYSRTVTYTILAE